MTLLDYHRLREEEKRTWSPAKLEESTRSVDGQLPERVAALLPREGERTHENLMTLRHGELDDRFYQLCELFRDSPAAVRTYIRSLVTPGLGRSLSGLAARAAVLGLRKGDPAQIRLGLLGFVMDDLASGDVRDTLIFITLSYHALLRSGADADAAFREAAEIASAATRAVLLDYVKPGAPRSLGNMGWREHETPDGPGFRGW